VRQTPRSFVVEVRRRRGRPTIVDATPGSGEAFRDGARDRAKEVGQSGGRERDQAEKQDFEFDPIRPSGRILPSLIETSPETLSPAAAEPLRRRARADSKPTKPTEVIAASVSASDRATPPSGHAAAGCVIASRAAPRESAQAQSSDAPLAAALSPAGALVDSERSAVKSTASGKSRRWDDTMKAHPSSLGPQTAPSPIDVGPSPTPDAAKSSPKKFDGASRERQRSIMARYVFGTELKPGERWKLRLRRAR
jgi:hypothetical protein